MKSQRQTFIFTLLAAALVLSLICGGIFTGLYLDLAGRTLPTYGENAATLSEALTEEKKQNDTLRNIISALEREADALESEAQVLREENDRLQGAVSADAADTEEIVTPPDYSDYDPGDILPKDPDTLSYALHLEEQIARLKALEEAVMSPALIVTPEGKIVEREGYTFPEDTEILYRDAENTAYDESGIALSREIDWEAMGYSIPKISLSYKDFERDTAYSIGGDEEWFSASLIKAPYVYTVLLQFAKYNEIKEANPTNDPALGKVLSPEVLEKYDLARKVTITKDRIADGSGVIRDMEFPEEGLQFTVLELIDYSVRLSDNTAFKVLRDEFGYDHFWAVSASLGVTSIRKSFNKLTSKEAVIYLSAIYDFAKEYPDEGGMLISLMKKSSHPLVITPAMPNKGDVAHKYGWDEDTYHDMAIVYGDAPFALCIMTNFDITVNTPIVNDCLSSIAKSVYEIHTAFYKEAK